MQLSTIRYIVTVAQCGNITNAAQQLYISQPALSQSIHRAEQELHAKLFIRQNGRVVPTPAGELLVREGIKILKIEDSFHQQLSELLEQESQKVLVGAATSYQRFFLTYILSEFQRQVPDVHITIEDGYSAELCDRIRAKQLDFALVCEPFPDDLEHIPVFREEVFLAISEDHPLYPVLLASSEFIPDSPYPYADLSLCRKEKFIYYSEGRRIQRILLDETARAGFTPQISTLCVSTEAANLLAQHGMGLALVPAVSVTLCAERRRPRYFRIRREGLFRTLAIVGRASQKHVRTKDVLVDILRNSQTLLGNEQAFFQWNF